MSINVTTSANGEALNELLTPLVLGATTIDRGLMRIVPNQQNSVALGIFDTLADKLEAPVDTPILGNDSMSKSEVIVTTGDQMWYDEFNPLRDFQEDWSYFWSSGRLTDAQAGLKIKQAILKTVTESVQNNIDKLIWSGDTASLDVWLQRMDGLIKLIEANLDVNVVTPAGVLTKANIIDVLEAMIDATPDQVLEMQSPKIIMSHRDKQIYFSAIRDATISKGINIMEGGVPTFAGIPIISCGIPKDHLVLTNATSGADSNLVGATWMWADTKGVKVERLQANSEVWFAKVLFKLGVNIVFGSQLTYYKPV